MPTTPRPGALLALAALLLAAPLAAQPLDPDTQAELRAELAAMLTADGQVRTMWMAGTFSAAVADSIDAAHEGLDVPATLEAEAALRAAAAARLSEADRDRLLDQMRAVDRANTARLREIVEAHGWPSADRVGGDAEPFVLLMHAGPEAVDALVPLLTAEVEAGRMPPLDLARVVDKGRKIRGQLQLYGTGREFDAATRTVLPPLVASIEATNAARRALGLPDLEAYRVAE